jgi:hypothetical protein
MRRIPSWHYGTLYLFSGKSYEKIVQKKDPGNCTQSAIVPYIILVCSIFPPHDTCVIYTPISGKSYEKTVQKKDPGNDLQCGTIDTLLKIALGQKDKMFSISGKSSEKTVQKKDYGNCEGFV